MLCHTYPEIMSNDHSNGISIAAIHFWDIYFQHILINEYRMYRYIVHIFQKKIDQINENEIENSFFFILSKCRRVIRDKHHIIKNIKYLFSANSPYKTRQFIKRTTGKLTRQKRKYCYILYGTHNFNY